MFVSVTNPPGPRHESMNTPRKAVGGLADNPDSSHFFPGVTRDFVHHHPPFYGDGARDTARQIFLFGGGVRLWGIRESKEDWEARENNDTWRITTCKRAGQRSLLARACVQLDTRGLHPWASDPVTLCLSRSRKVGVVYIKCILRPFNLNLLGSRGQHQCLSIACSYFSLRSIFNYKIFACLRYWIFFQVSPDHDSGSELIHLKKLCIFLCNSCKYLLTHHKSVYLNFLIFFACNFVRIDVAPTFLIPFYHLIKIRTLFITIERARCYKACYNQGPCTTFHPFIVANTNCHLKCTGRSEPHPHC